MARAKSGNVPPTSDPNLWAAFVGTVEIGIRVVETGGVDGGGGVVSDEGGGEGAEAAVVVEGDGEDGEGAGGEAGGGGGDEGDADSVGD